MKAEDLLKHIGSLLTSEKVDNTFIAASEAQPTPMLAAYVGNDYKNRERSVAIFAQPQTLKLAPNKLLNKEGTYIRVQFQLVFPFQTTDQTASDTATVLHFINRVLELPGFEMDELQNRVLYRYVWLTDYPGNDSTLIISILGLIAMTLDLFTESIEKIASGESTFNELLKEIHRQGEQYND